MRNLMRDKVSLIKEDGSRFDNIKANVQQDKIFITDASLLIEEGDKLIRTLPNNLVEYYIVLDRGYYEGTGSIPPHYQVKVRKESAIPDRTPPSVVYNLSGISSRVNINSQDMKKEGEIISKANLEDRPTHAEAVRTLFKHPNFPRMMCLNGSIVENPIYDYLKENTIDRIRLDYGPNGSKKFRIMPLDLFLIKGVTKHNEPMILFYYSGKSKSGWKSYLTLFHPSNKEKNLNEMIKKHQIAIKNFLKRKGRTVVVIKLPDTNYLVSFKIDQGYKDLVAYIFTFCYVNISGKNSDIAKREFKWPVGKYTRKFKWYFTEELEEDRRMMECDADVVRYIHNVFGTALIDVPPSITDLINESEFEYDAFICHASEDKEQFVTPLAEELNREGLKVWYDEFTLTVGDSLRRSIDYGLSRSRYGIVVLSHNFFKKEWPQKELDALVARDDGENKVILPVWHGVDKKDIQNYSPLLADRIAVSSNKGLNIVVLELLRAIQNP